MTAKLLFSLFLFVAPIPAMADDIELKSICAKQASLHAYLSTGNMVRESWSDDYEQCLIDKIKMIEERKFVDGVNLHV